LGKAERVRGGHDCLEAQLVEPSHRASIGATPHFSPPTFGAMGYRFSGENDFYSSVSLVQSR